MAIPREKGGSQESSPPGQPNGGQGTREQAADSGSPEQSSILQKKEREGNSSERWPGSQNPGPLESENSWSGGQRACPAQMCADSGEGGGAQARGPWRRGRAHHTPSSLASPVVGVPRALGWEFES